MATKSCTAFRTRRTASWAPVVEGPLQVIPKGALYLFAVPELEAQGPIEKHLLRMGPRNTRLIQSKAREISSALQH